MTTMTNPAVAFVVDAATAYDELSRLLTSKGVIDVASTGASPPSIESGASEVMQ